MNRQPIELPLTTLHVVSHTHWDREWYHQAERFRQRLVDLVDDLLERPDAASFLLDGQTVVLEDYLAVRPDRASELSSALREGRLEAGPWFVLPDELIPGGEGLVRNLLAGARSLRALRAQAPAVLYCPDSFGHPAALPSLASGFGAPVVIVWRGFGGDDGPAGDVFQWTAPSGERAILFHLTRSGYELGANLPREQDAAARRWREIEAQLQGRGTAGVALLLNGADHHALQRDVDAAIAALQQAAAPMELRRSTLGAFARDLADATTGRGLPDVAGELRNSYGFTWTLQGTLATRTGQKRRYARLERVMVRDVEPWAALARWNGARSRGALTRAAWRDLLLCQPHDTLCGTSIDAVARAMDARLDAAAAQASGLRDDALADIIGHDRDAARVQPDAWRPVLVVRNAAARARSGVARVTLSVKMADVPVGPGSAHVELARRALDADEVRWPLGEPVQPLSLTVAHERTEAPRAYPDNDAVARFDALVWVDEVNGYGVRTFPFGADAPDADVRNPVEVRGRSISNGRIAVRWDARGRFTLEDLESGRSIKGLFDWESRRDLGDLYTPAIRGRKFAHRVSSTRVQHTGPLRGMVEQRWRFSARGERLEVNVQVIVDADAPFVRLRIEGENAATNHRLRLRLRTDVRDGAAIADAAFGPVERAIDERPSPAMELRVPTAPLHRYVSLFAADRGATLYSDGLTEYEARRDGFAVTVLRSVGELSRSNLPERPGHAGWPASTPGAQGIGPFVAELGLWLHGPRQDATAAAIERTADDVLWPLTGETLRSAIRVAGAVPGVSLEGEGLALSTIKESEDGEWLVLRCVNVTGSPIRGRWRTGRIVSEARLARLDETPGDALAVQGEAIAIDVPPRGIRTVLAR